MSFRFSQKSNFIGISRDFANLEGNSG